MNLVILPNQLFDIKYLDKNYKITLWEHPQYLFNLFNLLNFIIKI